MLSRAILAQNFVFPTETSVHWIQTDILKFGYDIYEKCFAGY